jgi:hypothetical protein
VVTRLSSHKQYIASLMPLDAAGDVADAQTFRLRRRLQRCYLLAHQRMTARGPERQRDEAKTDVQNTALPLLRPALDEAPGLRKSSPCGADRRATARCSCVGVTVASMSASMTSSASRTKPARVRTSVMISPETGRGLSLLMRPTVLLRFILWVASIG